MKINKNKMNKRGKDMNKMKQNKNNCLFVFFCLLLLLFLLALGFRDSGITCIWILIKNMFLDMFSNTIWLCVWQKMQNIEIIEKTCKKQRKSQTCCKGVSGAMCCGKIWECLRVASVVKTKSLLIGHSLNRLNEMK